MKYYCKYCESEIEDWKENKDRPTFYIEDNFELTPIAHFKCDPGNQGTEIYNIFTKKTLKQ